MALLPDITTREVIEDLVAWTVKEHKIRVMPRLKDKVSHTFTPEILAMKVPPHVQTLQIACYRGEDNPVEDIQRHEAILMGRINDDNLFCTVFP